MTNLIEVDAAALEKLTQRLDPDEYRDLVMDFLTDVGHYAESQVKEFTPVETGNLRRSERTDLDAAGDFPAPFVRVVSDQPYAEWIETGERESDGALMLSMPGGYRMFEGGADMAADKSTAIAERLAREIEARWAS